MENTLRTARLLLVPADLEELRVKFDGPDGPPLGGVSFKGAPGPDGVVEIAYGIDEEFRLRGYATEAAGALVMFAFADARVQIVCAHTLPGAVASRRVLAKCGFTRVADVVDPEDGPVWRFEQTRPR